MPFIVDNKLTLPLNIAEIPKQIRTSILHLWVLLKIYFPSACTQLFALDVVNGGERASSPLVAHGSGVLGILLE